MNRLALIVISVTLAIVVIGGVVLASVDLPAPSAKVVRPVPDDKLAH